MKLEDLRVGMAVMLTSAWVHKHLQAGMIGHIENVEMRPKIDGSFQPTIVVRIPSYANPLNKQGLYDFHPEHLLIHRGTQIKGG